LLTLIPYVLVAVLFCSCWLISSLQNEPVHKLVFMVFFQGNQLKSRVKKICDG
jgi:hypothetical protein